eukprot:TRINITY_DN368_c1_g1_i20.p1 TRINITY_DN368_c1_g1~~TRINITY_DN368_c1_g1_i20.p1  ORF type:complete len:173 (+),score=26.27 TRINITY_DN368_c1_g1_i20:179-697(+)
MSEDKSKTSVGTVVTQQGVPITPDSTKEEVATWLATLEGGRFARPGLEEATGADLYRMSENAFMTALGPVLGGSLYALLHPVQGTLNQLVSEVQTLKRQREEDKEQISRQEGLISQLTVELEVETFKFYREFSSFSLLNPEEPTCLPPARPLKRRKIENPPLLEDTQLQQRY